MSVPRSVLPAGLAAASAQDRLRPASWALLAGNFAIGCGIFVVPGSLNDIARSLKVPVSLAGQLIAIAAVVMCFGAPLVAGYVAAFDRRRLLAWTLVWYAVGHVLCALSPGYPTLVVLRALTVIGAAVFTPQAAAAMGVMAEPAQRGRAITFVFLGWSLASVLGMPTGSYIGEAFGWRWAFGFASLLAAGAAVAVWRTMPDGVKPAALSRAAWRSVFTQPVLMATVAVTALSAAGQFTLFSYFAPIYRNELHADPGQMSLLFFWFGAFGLAGNLVLSRWIDRIGAARAATATVALMALSLLSWPLAGSVVAMLVVLVPWGLGCFSANSAQQARLGLASPALAPALLALNTSAIYLGQAIGSGGGGAIVAATGGYAWLNWVGLAWMIVAVACSLWVEQRRRRDDSPHAR